MMGLIGAVTMIVGLSVLTGWEFMWFLLALIAVSMVWTGLGLPIPKRIKRILLPVPVPIPPRESDER